MSVAIANQMGLAFLGRGLDVALSTNTGALLNGTQPPKVLLDAWFQLAIADGVFSTADSTSTIVNKVFNNIFGRDALPFEQDAWGDLTSGDNALSLGELVWGIWVGYLGATNVPDEYKIPAQSRLIASQAYTDALANNPDANAEASQIGSNAADAARDFLDGVVDQATAAAKVAGAQDAVDGIANAGQTFTLTEASDQIPGLIGTDGTTDTSGNDTIIGGLSNTGGPVPGSTLGTGDVLDGGDGFDTLSAILPDGSNLNIAPNLSNIERVDIQQLGTGSGNTLNFINSDGVEQIWLVDNPDFHVVTSDNVGDDAIIGFHNVGEQDSDGTILGRGTQIVDFQLDAIQDGALDVVTQDSVADLSANLNDDTAPVNTINITATDGPSDLRIGVNGNNDIETLNILGDSFLKYEDNGNTTNDLDNVNVSNTAGVDVDLTNNDEDITIAGGSGNDRFVLRESQLDEDDTLDGGAGGMDILAVLGDVNNGGAGLGFDGLADVDGNDDPESDVVQAANGATNFEVLELIPGPEDTILDADLFTSIDMFKFTDGDGLGGPVNNITVTDAENDDTFTVMQDGTVNSVSITAEQNADALSLFLETPQVTTLELLGFDTIALDLQSGNNFTSNAVTVSDGTVLTVTGDVDKDANVTGQLNVEFAGGEVTADFSAVNTDPGTGNANTINGSDDDETITGTEQDDVIEGDGGDDVLIGGAGDDVLDGGQEGVMAGIGITEIDLTALNDIDGNNDGDDDTVSEYNIQIDGTLYTAVAGSAAAAAVIIAANATVAGGNIASATANAGVITVTSIDDTPVPANNLAVDVTPAAQAVNIAGNHTPTEAATPGIVEITIAETSIAVNTVITYNFDDGTDNVDVSYTVLNTDIGATDADTAQNVAAGLAAAIAAEVAAPLGNGVATPLTGATLSVVGNVVTVTDAVAGATDDIQGTEVLDASGIGSVANTPGVDAVTVETFEITTGFLPDADGELEVTLDGVTATIPVTDGVNVTAAQIAAALEAADAGDATINGDDGNATLNFTNDNATPPVISATFTPDLIQDVPQDGSQITTTAGNAATTVFGQDTLTGGTGEDLFIVASDAVTEAAADEITDFVDGEDTIDFSAFAGPAGSATNYSEGPINGFGDFLGAVTQANSDFGADPALLYVAQQVGADTFLFASNGGGQADDVVKLTGVSLADLDDDGAFLV